MGIAGRAFSQNQGVLVGLWRGQALDEVRLYDPADVPEQSCANEPVRGQGVAEGLPELDARSPGLTWHEGRLVRNRIYMGVGAASIIFQPFSCLYQW